MRSGTMRSRRRWARLGLFMMLLAVATALVAPATAFAADASSIAAVRDALDKDPVYVAPDAEGASLVDADALRRDIGDAPIVVAVLPTQARQATGGSVDQLPEAIGGRRAVVVLCGRSLRAGASSAVLPARRAGELAAEAQRDHSGAFNRSNVQGALADLVSSLKREMANRGSAGGGSSSGGRNDDGTPVWPWVLGGLVLVGGGGAAYAVSRRRRRAREEQRRLDDARAEVSNLYSRLGADVSNLDPGSDRVARQAMADASERYTAAGALLSRASTPEEVAAAGAAAAEGLHATRVARQRLGLDVGPPIPEPLNTGQGGQAALDRPQEVQVGGSVYQGYPTYAPGAPYYFPGGTVGGGYVPGGWYGSRFWEGALLGGLAGTVLAGGLGGFGGFGGFGLGGFGWGGFGPGYGMGYGSGYESGYDAGLERGQDENGGDWSGDGDWSGGGDWGGDGGGGDWGGGGGDLGGGDFGGGDFGGGDSGGGDW